MRDGLTETNLTDDSLTEDRLLGGRVLYRQPREGFRAAIDPVLLAAAIPAWAGEHVLEGGTGAGAALLCLAARVPGITGLGIDRDPALVLVARANAAANSRHGLDFVAGDLAASPLGGGASGRFDHAFANPPYHAPEGTPSPHPAREGAKRGASGTLGTWAAALAKPLRYRGTLTFILPPRLLEECLLALRAARAPAEWVFPIWSREGTEARLMLIRGRKGGRAPLTLAPGLILHQPSGAFRPEAEAVLREGAGLQGE